MKIFAINLAKDVERRISLLRQCDNLGLSIERVAGVYGRALTQTELQASYRPAKARRNHGREMNPAEIGCALSHISIYRRIVDKKIPCALVLEDDVVLDDRLSPLLESLQLHLDASKPIVVLLSPARGQLASSIRVDDIFTLSPYLAGFYTHAYVVTYMGAKALLRALYPVGNVADCWRRLVRHRVVDIQVVQPVVVVQDQKAFGSSTTADARVKPGGQGLHTWLIYKGRRAFWLTLDAGVSCYNRWFNPYCGVLRDKS